jgi:hypothetical protein
MEHTSVSTVEEGVTGKQTCPECQHTQDERGLGPGCRECWEENNPDKMCDICCGDLDENFTHFTWNRDCPKCLEEKACHSCLGVRILDEAGNCRVCWEKQNPDKAKYLALRAEFERLQNGPPEVGYARRMMDIQDEMMDIQDDQHHAQIESYYREMVN